MVSSIPYQNPNLNSNPNPTFDEQRWIIHIRRTLENEDDLESESDFAVSICNVPKLLSNTSPESYIPQLVALGPYHHFRPELYEMERYKLSIAKKSQKNGRKFHNLVDELYRAEQRFRACYHKFINFNGETLAWMMAVDSCFLLEFLHGYAVGDGGTGRKSGNHDAILRDTVMLENQIPLFSVKKTLEFVANSVNGDDDRLYTMVIGFCREVSPFVMIEELGNVDLMNKSAHLLEFLYNLTVLGFQQSEIALDEDEESSKNDAVPTETAPFSLIKRLACSKAIKLLLTLPWKIFSNLPGVIILRQIKYSCFSREKHENNNNNDNNKTHPLMEEIAIPSVTELSSAGVKFKPTESGISGINFDGETAEFHLPPISIDINTEVAMRNLVAYEACGGGSRPLICARYTELMNGIIDGEEDARILRENGVVLNHLKSDKDVADLWNGMSKSVRMTRVPLLDRVIEDVNCYYEGRWKVRIGKFLKKYVFGSWQSLVSLAAFLLLFFVGLQAFCSIFGLHCGRRSRV